MIYILYDSSMFDEIAEQIHQSLLSQKVNNSIINKIPSSNDIDSGDIYIILGLSNMDLDLTGQTYVVYQFEQTTCRVDGQSWFTGEHGQQYIQQLKNAQGIYDYSPLNVKNLSAAGITAELLPLKWSPCLENVTQLGRKDIDVLFMGTENDRRNTIFAQFKDKKIKLVTTNSAYRNHKNSLISSSKIVLNIHYYDNSILEIARLYHLISNGVFVISERSTDLELNSIYEQYVIFSDTEKIAETCEYWLKNDNLRKKFARDA